MLKKAIVKTLVAVSMAAALSLTAGCGNTAFKVGTDVENQKSPGTYMAPAQVDIVLVEDNSASTFEAHDQISAQMPGVLVDLENKGWDYHFTSIPLVTEGVIDQIATSKFDGNWALNGRSSWKAPFPGALPEQNMVDPEYFVEDYTNFLSFGQINKSVNADEPGFEMIKNFLNSPLTSNTGFLREDAMLVILVVGNGNDNSPGGTENECTTDDGKPTFCNITPVEDYAADYQSLKASNDMVRFYSAVSKVPSSTECLGSYGRPGVRYMEMSDLTGGRHYDICNEPVSGILGSLKDELQDVKKNYRQKYIVLDGQIEPDPESIVIKKYVDGLPSQEIVLEKDKDWIYLEGGIQTVKIYDVPANLNEQTGYVIELLDHAKLSGADTADVSFKPLGAVDSAADSEI